MYRNFKIAVSQYASTRGGTDGYQPKFVFDNGETFVKVQCRLQNQYVNDWRVEDIASRLCEQLGFYAVKQTPCRITMYALDRKEEVYGVYSDNFENKGLKFYSLESLFNKNNLTLQRNSEYDALNSVDKMKWIAKQVSQMLETISYEDYLKYLVEVAIVDILVCNVDRHARNLGFMYNSNTKSAEIAPIFDCGMGLFENDLYFSTFSQYVDCLRYCYVEPYSEDPFRLLEELDSAFGIKQYIINTVSELKADRGLFPSKKAYEYFKEVTKRIGVNT